MAQLEEERSSLLSQIEEKDKVIKQYEIQIQEKDEQIAELKAQKETLQAFLDSINASGSSDDGVDPQQIVDIAVKAYKARVGLLNKEITSVKNSLDNQEKKEESKKDAQKIIYDKILLKDIIKKLEQALEKLEKERAKEKFLLESQISELMEEIKSLKGSSGERL